MGGCKPYCLFLSESQEIGIATGETESLYVGDLLAEDSQRNGGAVEKGRSEGGRKG